MDPQHDSFVHDFEATGIFGWLIVLATAGLVLAGLVFAVLRVPRLLAMALLAASLVGPIFLGTAGYFIGRAEAARVIATLRAPTPKDLACGRYESEYCLVFGLAAALVCYAAAFPAFARSTGSDEPAGAR
jgi:hypothetical protein